MYLHNNFEIDENVCIWHFFFRSASYVKTYVGVGRSVAWAPSGTFFFSFSFFPFFSLFFPFFFFCPKKGGARADRAPPPGSAPGWSYQLVYWLFICLWLARNTNVSENYTYCSLSVDSTMAIRTLSKWLDAHYLQHKTWLFNKAAAICRFFWVAQNV